MTTKTTPPELSLDDKIKDAVKVLNKLFKDYESATLLEDELALELKQAILNAEAMHLKKLESLPRTSEAIKKEMQAIFDTLNAVYLSEKGKNLDTLCCAYCKVGLKEGRAKIAYDEGLKESDIIEKLRKKQLTGYLIEKASVNKQLILRNNPTNAQAKQLEACGIKIVKDPEFYVKKI